MCYGLDDLCCTNQDKTMFFGVWTLGHGIVFLIGQYIIYVFEKQTVTFITIVIIACIIHIIAGIFILSGYFLKEKNMFVVGIALSWILPVINFYFIYLLVLQIIFTITSYRFYLTDLKPA